jgi:hypothetical protein
LCTLSDIVVRFTSKALANKRVKPTRSASLRVRLTRVPLGADGMNFEKDNAWLLGQVAWRGMLPAQVTFGR